MKTRVYIFEYERGWGSRIDETKEFDTHEEAEAFAARFNASNTEPTAPDWYMVARVEPELHAAQRHAAQFRVVKDV